MLGTAQDGGIPHAACSCVRCEAARRDPGRRRWVTSLAIILPSRGQVFLVDATPDIRPQLDAVRPERKAQSESVERRPVDGVLLTHAHIGHYTGLVFFGFEAVHTRGLPVYCTAEMASFLRSNGPWDQLVRLENIKVPEITPGTPFSVAEEVTATALPVPHRHEYTDTVGYVLRGPRTSLLYVPDTDSWRAWQRPLPEVLDGIDIALLDGTFYSESELPGRDVSKIGHPTIVETMDLLEPFVRTRGLRVYFTHLNHSNPALVPGGNERATIERRGFHVLEDGQEFPL